MLHGFASRVRYVEEEWAQYVEANATYARLAGELAAPDATIWVHDYHLLLVGAALRHRGHRGPLGLFLHVPFPSRDVFETTPWAAEIVDGMLAYDLIGFHTRRHVENFLAAARDCLGVTASEGLIRHRRGVTEIAPFPIGIDPERFQTVAADEQDPEVAGLRTNLGDRRLLLGVDRLDYSKGIPERLEAFERLLDRHPRWLRRVSMVQVSVPSRADVPEYRQLRERVENLVGRINGRFGDADWVPVRYLYRSYGHDVLAQLYRAADVAVVTPLRDGMNLVAKEFVAAQDPARPGVLLLSRFAGASDELDAALLTNPFYRDGLADDLDRALAMPLDERRARHRRLLESVLRNTSADWATRFLDALHLAHRASPAGAV
jgi:trehalose 6-phosphate synthase